MYPRLFGELTTVECYIDCSSLGKAEYNETVIISIWVCLTIFWVAEEFENIFEDTLKINMMDNKAHEDIQQKIIDILNEAFGF